MSGQFFFMRILAVCGSHEPGDLLRQGAGVGSITVDVSTVSAAAASLALAKDDVDVVFVDGGISEAEQGKVIAAARASRHPPFVFLPVLRSRMATDLAPTGQPPTGWSSIRAGFRRPRL